jgi:hypothetical protein
MKLQVFEDVWVGRALWAEQPDATILIDLRKAISLEDFELIIPYSVTPFLRGTQKYKSMLVGYVSLGKYASSRDYPGMEEQYEAWSSLFLDTNLKWGTQAHMNPFRQAWIVQGIRVQNIGI